MGHLPHAGPPPSPGRSLSVRIEPFDSDAVRWVVAEAEAELMRRYGFMADSETGLSAAKFDPPAGAFLVARAAPDGFPVGGVGLRPHTRSIGEVKRLWVHPDRRGQGIAVALMRVLDAAALTLGFVSLRLETGAGQPEAVALYARSGWLLQDEDWEGGPIRAGSIHFAKRLA